MVVDGQTGVTIARVLDISERGFGLASALEYALEEEVLLKCERGRARGFVRGVSALVDGEKPYRVGVEIEDHAEAQWVRQLFKEMAATLGRAGGVA